MQLRQVILAEKAVNVERRLPAKIADADKGDISLGRQR